MEKRQRSIALDFLRVISAFLVIFNHTGDKGFAYFTQHEPGSVMFYGYLFMSVFCKVAVPVFFAISGALLLKKKESLKQLYLHRVLKTVILLVIISFVYYVLSVVINKEEFSLSYFFLKLYSSEWSIHLWFLYAYLAFLVTLPFLRAMVSKLENKYFWYIILLVLLFSDVRKIAEYLLFNGEITLNYNVDIDWIASNVVLYPCIGYYLYNRRSPRGCRKIMCWLWPVNLCCIALCCYLTYLRVVKTGECSEAQSQMFHGRFVILNCISLFVTARYMFAKWTVPSWLRRVITSVAECSLGVYLFHMIFLGRGTPVVPFFRNIRYAIYGIPNLNMMVASLIVCLCVMLMSYIATIILRKIPGIRKLIS